MIVRIEEKSVEVDDGSDIAAALKQALSGRRFRGVVAVRIGSQQYDLTSILADGMEQIAPIYADSPEGLQIIRHSTSHVMALAVKRLFPKALVTIGPSIENGFYYDFDVATPFTEADMERIEGGGGRSAGGHAREAPLRAL